MAGADRGAAGPVRLTAEDFGVLTALCRICPFKGLRPGSNFWPDVYLETEIGDVDGERFDAFARRGYFRSSPCQPSRIPSRTGDGEDIPAEADHVWSVTDAGRAALEGGAGEGGGEHA